MNRKEGMLFFLAGAVMFSGCSHAQTAKGSAETSVEKSSTDAAAEVDTTNMFSDRDKEIGYEESESVAIRLADDNSSCTSDAVSITENTVTITDEGTYVLSGTLTEGMVLVEAEDTDKVQLVLDNASVSNSQSAALYIRSADKVFVTLAAESENSLENGGTYTAIDDNNIDAAVFSKSDLTFNGEGTLTVTAEAGHGIVSKDDLVFTSGTYRITGDSHGISGKDSVRIANGSYEIVSGKDGIHAENTDDEDLGFVYLEDGTFQITSGQDGISAGSWLQAEGGSYTVTTGQGSAAVQKQEMPERMPGGMQTEETSQEDTVSVKGLKSGAGMTLKDGSFTLDTEDDALHSNENLEISGGTYTLASGDDGIHGDSGVLISGGTVDITESYEGIEGLSIDITGGEISLLASDDGINAAGGNAKLTLFPEADHNAWDPAYSCKEMWDWLFCQQKPNA